MILRRPVVRQSRRVQAARLPGHDDVEAVSVDVPLEPLPFRAILQRKVRGRPLHAVPAGHQPAVLGARLLVSLLLLYYGPRADGILVADQGQQPCPVCLSYHVSIVNPRMSPRNSDYS